MTYHNKKTDSHKYKPSFSKDVGSLFWPFAIIGKKSLARLPPHWQLHYEITPTTSIFVHEIEQKLLRSCLDLR